MLFRPLSSLFALAFRFTLKIVLGTSTPIAIITLLSSMLTVSRVLFNTVRTEGVVRTYRILNQIRGFIVSPNAIINIHTNLRTILTNSGLSALKINSIINTLTPLLIECIKLPNTFSKGFNIFNTFYS